MRKHKVLSFFLFLCLLVSLYLLIGCTTLINSATFYPSSGESYALSHFETPIQQQMLTTKDKVRISSYFIPHPSSKQALILFHGNAGNASDRLPEAVIFQQFGLNVLVMDYRGYGLSDGSPSEKGIYLDAQAGIDFLKEKGFSTEQTFVYGRSLGSTAAIHIAQHQSYAGLILLSPLSSGKAVAKHRGLSWLIPLHSPFNNLDKVANIHTPLLIVHGDQDQVLPIHMGEDLFAAANEPKQFFTVTGGSHNNLLSLYGRVVYEEIKPFIELHKTKPYVAP